MEQERPRRGRRLAAIVAADVAGYSRLMHDDEEGTHARLTALLANVVEPAIAEHGGRVVKYTGDGFLAEFPSAVEAVRAARHFQENIRERTSGETEDQRLVFRVGINIGDVIVEAHDIFGDGVNIAARLEGIAEPGGICISSSAYDQVRGKVAADFIDMGDQNLKNISCPIRTYAIGPKANVRRVAPAPSLPRLSIVVLPFANIGGDPEQEYFVDGMAESLTTDLSRINGAFVIARNTAFTFKGKVVDVKRLGRELNVRYVLEGSLQRGSQRLRVNVQLIDAETGKHLWAERFDKPLADLFDMQDEIVSRLANALDAELVAAEARRAEHSANPDVMDLVFQGRALWNRGWTPEYTARARGFFERALVLDPENIEAMVGLASVDVTEGAALLTDDPSERLAAAEAISTKALSLAPNHAVAHITLGTALICTKRVAQGIAEFEHALALDRNSALAHGLIGWAKNLLGRSAETETHIIEALRLSPRDTHAHQWLVWVGFAKVVLNADTEAVAWMRRGLEANRNYPTAHFHLAAVLARRGEIDEARAAVIAGLGLDPNFTMRRWRAGNMWSDNPAYLAGRERQCEGMRLAGVPEG
ncbi:adenylate/guanylate cyclase domain-containing protein [Bradyrhizobium sp.]|uniref:adenylate/guanylate cyclase domain-containing protein n=1 Tax=Bradyrhizobium sp. TaxID=376 RepID=UPI002CFC1F44|nr:tetratricopeptide repeat protein [Bradyrhizobium sp.]HMM89584.1 adenylate/guanylate cyclase domain-containing protein [Bradyrhizobium sp.]